MSNALTLITPTLDPLGIMIDPTLCHMNHSCNPNAYIMMDGPRVSVRTLRPIKKDKEIYISYIDATNPYHRRQEELQSRWFFTCRCAQCQEKATLQEDTGWYHQGLVGSWEPKLRPWQKLRRSCLVSMRNSKQQRTPCL